MRNLYFQNNQKRKVYTLHSAVMSVQHSTLLTGSVSCLLTCLVVVGFVLLPKDNQLDTYTLPLGFLLKSM